MRHVAAYLLLVLGGNTKPTVEDVTKVITAVGGEVDAERLATLVKELEGKDIAEVIAEGQKKLATVSVGASSAAAPAAGGAAPAAAAAKEEAKKEEEEEADLGGGMDMFGGGSDY